MKRLVVLSLALLLATPALALDDYGQKSITTGTYCKDITNSEGTAAVIISGTWTGTGTLQRNDTRLLPGTPTTTFGVNTVTRAVVSTFTANGTFLIPVAGASQACVNFAPGSGTMTVFIDLSIAPFPGALAVLTDNIASVNGTTTQANNSAAPPAAGLLPAATAIANAAVPTWTEGFEVLKSVDLSGRERVVGTTANDTSAAANSVETLPGIAVATPTATTAGRSEKLQVMTNNGGAVVNIGGGAGVLVADVNTTNLASIGNGVEVMPGVSRAGPAALTASRAQAVEMDTISGGVYTTESPTTNATGLTTTGIATVTASQSVKASAGNLYGFGVVNGAGAGCWLQCVNSAGAGTLGTAVIFQAPIPTSATAYSQPGPIPLGSFSTGIACGVASAINGASACGTAATGISLYYK